jgi:hypothetical protein
MHTLRSYSSPFNLGHKALTQLFTGAVVVQEKYDGSQISFGVRDGELFVRSRRVAVDLCDPGMFDKAVGVIQSLYDKLEDGWTYRGEYFAKPKHNTLAYNRIPQNHIMVFDIDRGDQDYITDHDELEEICTALEIECARRIAVIEKAPSMDQIEEWLKLESTLGGPKIEGVVFKNYSRYGQDKKVLMGKYVSDKFKEKHSGDWKDRNPSRQDFIQLLIAEYATEARWMKAVQHLREEGKIEGVPQDIPIVMREIVDDVEQECAEEIKEKLFKHFWKDIKRGVNRGAPVWYKELLAQEALE